MASENDMDLDEFIATCNDIQLLNEMVGWIEMDIDMVTKEKNSPPNAMQRLKMDKFNISHEDDCNIRISALNENKEMVLNRIKMIDKV